MKITTIVIGEMPTFYNRYATLRPPVKGPVWMEKNSCRVIAMWEKQMCREYVHECNKTLHAHHCE